MKKTLLFLMLILCLNQVAYAKSDKPVRPVRPVSSNEDLYELVWHCTLSVTLNKTSTSTCVVGKFTRSRVFVPITMQQEHREMGEKTAKILDALYARETYPYEDARSKKPVDRPQQCVFEVTRGTTESSESTALVRKLAGVCPILFPSEQFLFKELLQPALDTVLYERGEVPNMNKNHKE